MSKELKVPKHRACGVNIVYNRLLEADPEARLRRGEIKAETSARTRAFNPFAEAAPVTLGVVVHLVLHDDADDIPDAQVHSQIEVLNRDFGLANPDVAQIPAHWRGLLVDSRIRFKLASIDPDGRPTDGVNRIRTSVPSFGVDDSVKFTARGGADAWDTRRYLNLWVCDLDQSLLGYAQFPGLSPATDGVVIDSQAFGSVGQLSPQFDGGRTAVHEVGHWLDLRHIWGDTTDCSGSDLVSDTPAQQHPNYTAPAAPHISCNNTPHGDMFMNYMDYVPDADMVMFTAGQVARMHATLLGPRASIVAAGRLVTAAPLVTA